MLCGTGSGAVFPLFILLGLLLHFPFVFIYFPFVLISYLVLGDMGTRKRYRPYCIISRVMVL